jgi:hypothetical protein
MTPRQLARKLHRLWRNIQDLHLEAASLVDHLNADQTCGRLALELVLHDLLALSARAATLGSFAEASRLARKSRKKP